MLEKILKEIEERIRYYRDTAPAEYVDVCAGLNEAKEIIRKYENTEPEEFRTLAQRATPKPLTNLNACPNCGRYIGNDVRPYCHSCGQRLDWEQAMKRGDGA